MLRRYSIWITNYNSIKSLERSLQTIIDQIDSDFEIVVVDNKSRDGSAETLRNYSDQHKIRLFEKRCSRGMGRQIAVEHATGDYIISGLDTDDTFRPRIRSLLHFYHDKIEGKLLSGFGEATMVAPRELLTQLGGWNDLQFRENWELSRRAFAIDAYRWTFFPLVYTINPHGERKSFLTKVRYRYIRYRDNLRVGHNQFDQAEHLGLGQKIVWFAAKISTAFLSNYKVDYSFSAIEPACFVDSMNYWPKDSSSGNEKELYSIAFQKERKLSE